MGDIAIPSLEDCLEIHGVYQHIFLKFGKLRARHRRHYKRQLESVIPTGIYCQWQTRGGRAVHWFVTGIRAERAGNTAFCEVSLASLFCDGRPKSLLMRGDTQTWPLVSMPGAASSGLCGFLSPVDDRAYCGPRFWLIEERPATMLAETLEEYERKPEATILPQSR